MFVSSSHYLPGVRNKVLDSGVWIFPLISYQIVAHVLQQKPSWPNAN